MSSDLLKALSIGAALAIPIGGLFLLVPRRRANTIERLRRLGHKASGVVVDHVWERRSGSFVPKVGERVTVLFDPDEPETVHIESRRSDLIFRTIWVTAWIITGGPPVALVVVLLLDRFLW